ncbi:hypothetical protein GH714_012604 [Hevea brasiliensis]|uniref:Sister chromatid cohesion protein n=1 Tax=Hevea brasiliensis TaxID=3981 RepID=A0A6A6MMS6_HEVBR|nr:hypothetical protein GH714_012604 [Hevea brasiliensis]
MSYSNSYATGSASGWTSGSVPRGIGLSNTIHSEVAPCLPLPSLPVFCGASDPHFRLFDETGGTSVRGVLSFNRSEILSQSARIADLLRETDVSYLNLRDETRPIPFELVEPSELHDLVLQCNPEAFEYVTPDLNNSVIKAGKMRDIGSSTRKLKAKKKGTDDVPLLVQPDPAELQDAAIGSFCDMLEEFCGRAEIMSDERDDAEWLSVPVSDVRMLVNEIMSICSKKLLHLVPVDILDSDAVSPVFCALESIHAALANIERILEFSKHQIMDVMSAYDPSYRALHKPSENGPPEGDEDEELETEYGSASKRRRTQKSTKLKKSTLNKVSGAVNAILQKLCTVLGLLKDLLLIERLSDSCILQLLKTSFTTFLVDNIQLLQLKAIGLIGGIFYSYALHRTYVIDEVVQLLWKLPFSKRVLRAYHLPDEERRQIQIITALLIQLVHSSANLPDPLREASSDLLTTLNLPEYPASAPILEVLCVLLLQNAGLKSKDISSRSLAIDLLGTVAARLKQDAVICCRNKFWILMELTDGDNVDQSYPKDACCVCLAGIVEKNSVYVSRFYLCLWYKDDPKSQQKLIYYLTRLKSNLVVSIIVEVDPEVLCDKRVQMAVEGRFCDSAISVREAALELVGRHIASHPDVGLKYFEKVAERIKDTGVSVRKRAIKIIRDMCTSNANFSEFTTACIEIISRISDDESSIQDLVCKTFYEFWFEEPSGLLTQYFGDGSSVPLEVAKKTEQIVEMLRKMPSHQLLVTVIKRNLALDFFPQSAKAAGINPVSVASVRKRCELMCKCLLEKILQVEEMSSKEMEVSTLPYVLALHAFCVVDATLCAPASDPSQFVVTLQPYLKTQVDNRAVAHLLESVIFIIDSVLPLIRKLPQSVVEELEQDLMHMIVRHSFLTVVHACIKCLCSLSRVAGKGAAVVEYLIQVFFKRLDALGTDNKQALGFVLIARPEYMLEKDIGKILEANLSSGSDVRLKIQALQNMYEYLLDSESQMGADKVSNDVNHYPVEGGHSVPVAAGAGDTNICGGIVQLYWDNILGRCLDFSEQVRQTALKIVEIVLRQGLVHPITCVPYLIALETDPQELNSKLAHHLLMNMNEKYPAFFESRLGDGLQLSFIFMQSCSVSPENLNQKLQSRAAGNLKGKPEGGSLVQARIGVSRIYKLIRGNRVSRNKFMSSIVRKFDNPTWTNSVIPFLCEYCTEVLAMLPFTSPDEPLYLIYAINRIIQVRAGALEANMKGLILHLSQRNSRKLPHENGVIQQEPAQPVLYHMPTMNLNGMMQQDLVVQPDLTPLTSFDLNGTVQEEPHLVLNPIASREPKMDRMSSADSFSISKNDEEKIQVDCLWAIALQLLLKLKRHLKVVYSLNDARCQAFSPNEPPKSGEVLSRQNIPFDISETSTSVPSTYQDLVQRYQELKSALKEDAVDYSTYTANIKRKRPTPRKTK